MLVEAIPESVLPSSKENIWSVRGREGFNSFFSSPARIHNKSCSVVSLLCHRLRTTRVTGDTAVVQLMSSMEVICSGCILPVEFPMTTAERRILTVSKFLCLECAGQGCERSHNSDGRSSIYESRTGTHTWDSTILHGPHKFDGGLNQNGRHESESRTRGNNYSLQASRQTMSYRPGLNVKHGHKKIKNW